MVNYVGSKESKCNIHEFYYEEEARRPEEDIYTDQDSCKSKTEI